MPLTLLDYGNPKPFGATIGKPRRLAWPVNVYRVTIPKVSADGGKMNPFERVILKLIDAVGYCDAKMLAQETCIPESLVQCVLLRLQDQGYLDEHNQIKQRNDKWANSNNVQHKFETACLFRELATGKILPHLHLMSDCPLKKKEVEERYYLKIPWNERHKHEPPEARDVLNAMRVMQRRCKVFGDESHLPSVQLITIAEDAELYYLDCPIAILRSDGEFRIADPFGKGFSIVLESAFMSLLEQDKSLGDWLSSWKVSLVNRNSDSPTVLHREPYDNDFNRARYPKLLPNLILKSHRRFRSIEQIHAVLEWALFYSCAQRLYNSAVQQLKLTLQSEHPSLLKNAAQTISLQWPPEGLFPVGHGKISDFLEGKAELGTVLSLSLLMAASDPSHPLQRLATVHPDFIKRLLKIKKERDESAHGSGRARSNDVEHPDEAFMREVVATLLPSIQFSDAPAPTVDKDAILDALMEARTSVQSEFGFALFNRFGTNLQDRLIAAEQFWLSCKDGDNALAFVCDLYTGLQAAFRRLLSGRLPPDIGDSEYVATAIKNAKNCGLGDLPKCLVTVKRTAIRETLLGNDQTLQSSIVAFLLVSPDDNLSVIAQTQPSFISDVALIIDRRGHGNEPLPLSKNDVRKLRKAAHTTIKTLQEV